MAQSRGGCGGQCPGSNGAGYDSMNQREYSVRSLDEYNARAPRMPPQSTPLHSSGLPLHHDTFGSQIDYNMSWMPEDAVLSDLAEHPSSRRSHRDPNVNLTGTSTIDTQYLDRASGYFQSKARGDSPIASPSRRSPKHESLLEWFDRSVEKELHERRLSSLNVGENLVNFDTPTNVKEKGPANAKTVLSEASTSGIDIARKLRSGMDTELLEAVDKLAKAEAMVSFEAAVRAAEEAAAAAPPEFAEEAAAARVQDFQAELTGVVKQEFSGSKPIEVIGYVGITRPKKPKKSDCTC